tara:strand:+ start:1278 stop:1925 length:648 start_codon:yes stop_codon:yes gene_type:complete
MRTYILLFLLIPLVSLSQRVVITGSSQQVTGQTLLTWGEGEYVTPMQNGRSSSIGLYVQQWVPLPLGYYTILLGAQYNIQQTEYDFSQNHPEIMNYGFTSSAIQPSASLRYRVFNVPDIFSAYLSVGARVNLESLTYSDEATEETLAEYDYNYLLPSCSIGAEISLTQMLSINPSISYQMDAIFFDEFSDISSEDLESAIEGAGVVTGVDFRIIF